MNGMYKSHDFTEPVPEVIKRLLPFMQDFTRKNFFVSLRSSSTASPLECISGLRSREHAAMFYNDSFYTDLIDAWYIQSGLNRGEVCIYATQSNPRKIRERMAARGIRVEFYESENCLYICQLSDATLDKKGLSRGVQRIIEHLLSLINSSKQSRILSDPWVGNIITPRKVEVNMEVERNVHAAFQLRHCDVGYEALKQFNGSLICRYNVEDHNSLTSNWFRNHLLNHHKSIIIPRGGAGIAFNTHSKYLSRSV
jgi:hypothetical protein